MLEKGKWSDWQDNRYNLLGRDALHLGFGAILDKRKGRVEINDKLTVAYGPNRKLTQTELLSAAKK
jgi:hypothetical protein